ncbi:MAG: HNH endonuclease [Fusicatenibacter sp.]|nr:HNH endonuclease [Fusicatenibacter sp.]
MKRFISFLLVLSLIVSLVGCSSSPPKPTLSDPNEQVIVENVETENIINETIITECITSEIYLEELIVAENKISELLLEEETINEVYLCKTIYVPQENIEEFAEHSQTSHLFGESIDFKSVLTKVAVGTGVIVTVVVLKKVGLPDPVMSVVAAAADESLKFGASGAAVGTLFGGLTGATDELDKSGRTSAVIGFATATVGLILSTISLVTVIPSGGSTTTTLAVGIKMVIAGISVVAATGGTAYAGYQAVKTFTSTDSSDIDWNNIDWDKLGVSSAEKAISNGADGYMWGSIIGVVHGGAEGYDFYQKYNTPYTKYNARLMQTPKEGNGGKWSGDRGESDFVLDEPIKLEDGTIVKKVTYKNAVPDFSPFQKAQVKIPNMTNSRSKNFRQADKALAEYWSKIKYEGKTWTRAEVEGYRSDNNLTWHEMSNMDSMQLVPHDVNQTFTHFGGVAEYNAMIGEEGVTEYE